MDFSSQETEPSPESETDDLLPLLDEGLEKLSEKDRDAVLLRFFDHRSFAEQGIAFGISEDAAQKRVSRARNKLRVFLRITLVRLNLVR